MDRRDFLSLRTRGRLRIAEISCERLYLRSIDARVSGVDPDASALDPVFEGEPPAAFDAVSSAGLFELIGEDVSDADVVRVTGPKWMDALDEEWRSGLDALLDATRTRGARVELAGSEGSTA